MSHNDQSHRLPHAGLGLLDLVDGLIAGQERLLADNFHRHPEQLDEAGVHLRESNGRRYDADPAVPSDPAHQRRDQWQLLRGLQRESTGERIKPTANHGRLVSAAWNSGTCARRPALLAELAKTCGRAAGGARPDRGHMHYAYTCEAGGNEGGKRLEKGA